MILISSPSSSPFLVKTHIFYPFLSLFRPLETRDDPLFPSLTQPKRHRRPTRLKFNFRYRHKQARQAAVQAAQKAIGFSYLLGKSDRIFAVALPTALVAFSFVAVAKGAMQMYTQPGKNS